MNKKKKEPIYDDWEEELLDEDFEEEEDEIFTCRVCGEDFTYESGDDYILLCDKCAEDFNMDQIWSDFDTGKLKEENLKIFDLEQYRYKI
jgi:hypothetical protein